MDRGKVIAQKELLAGEDLSTRPTSIVAVTGLAVGAVLLVSQPESAPDRSAARAEVFLGAKTVELRGVF